MGKAEMRTAGQHPSWTETGMPFDTNSVYALHGRVRKETRRKSIRVQSNAYAARRSGTKRIPGMLYADDMVRLADNVTDMQWLINSSGQEATALGLN